MTLVFRKEVHKSSFLDPRENFKLSEATSETRYDPITGELTRVFPFKQFKLLPHDWSNIISATKERGCPFCPEVVEQTTPLFPKELIPEGRLRQGKALVVPNLSPYSAYAGVIILGTEHYVPLRGIPVDLVVDGLTAGISFLKRVKKHDPANGRFGSIGWNYMPYSGGSIIHPHLQVLAGPVPGNSHRSMLESSAAYFERTGENPWAELVAAEKEAKDRYLWQLGSLHWLTTFAPRGVGDISVVFEGRTTLDDLTREDLEEFSRGLQRIFAFYASLNLPSFNLALYPAPDKTSGYWLSARIVGRFTIFNWTSDINSLQMLFGDFNSLVYPEEIAKEIANY